MIKTRRLFVLGALVLASVAACRSAPVPPPLTPISFANFGPIVLNVAAVDVVDARRPVPGAVSDKAPTPPVEAAKRWAAQRLQAAGSNGRVRVVVTDGSIVEQKLQKTDGVRGYFTNDQTARYDGRLGVEITGDLPGETSFRGSTRALATASATVAENASIAEREAVLNDLVRTLADSLNARLDAGIRKDLARLVVR